MALRRAFEGSALMLWLDQGNALKTLRAYVGGCRGHRVDCILAREGAQLGKARSVRIKARKVMLQMSEAQKN